eukprot:5409476-Karenia_brevis.AAC.1
MIRRAQWESKAGDWGDMDDVLKLAKDENSAAKAGERFFKWLVEKASSKEMSASEWILKVLLSMPLII